MKKKSSTPVSSKTKRQRAELEWRLYHRGRFAPEYHTISIATLKRVDAMFERLPLAQSMDDSIRCVHDSFVHEDERRAALFVS